MNNTRSYQAVQLWKKEVSSKSLWCGLTRAKYLNLINRSYIYPTDGNITTSISLLNRTYLNNGEIAQINSFHRLVSKPGSGIISLKIIADICANKSHPINVTSANDKALKIYKAFHFKKLTPTRYLHTYSLNPLLLPLALFLSMINEIYHFTAKALKRSGLDIFNRRHRIIPMIEKHISLRINNETNFSGLSINWNCETLKAYLNGAMDSRRILLHNFKIDDGKVESILMNIKYNHIWRTIVFLDATYEDNASARVFTNILPYLFITCLIKGAPRITIPTLTTGSPLKTNLFFRLRVLPSEHLIFSNCIDYNLKTEQDTRSLLFGDSFL